MVNGIGKLSSVSTKNVCRRDGGVLLNKLEDELHTRVPLLIERKLTSILPPYILKVWGESLTFASQIMLPNILAGVPRPPSWSPKLINQGTQGETWDTRKHRGHKGTQRTWGTQGTQGTQTDTRGHNGHRGQRGHKETQGTQRTQDDRRDTRETGDMGDTRGQWTQGGKRDTREHRGTQTRKTSSS